MIPSLTRDDIQNALEQIDREGVPSERQSVHYDLCVNEKRYPPKYVVSLATLHANGVAYPSSDFNAVEAKNYFIQRGYRIVDQRLEDGHTQKPSDLAAPAPERVETTTYRILRDTDLARRIKALHDYRCQICGHTIQLSDGSFYAEAHHIQPLGTPHNGPDVEGNIVCVCPNHHAELDYGVIPLKTVSQADPADHAIEKQYVDYHNQQIHKTKGPFKGTSH